MAEGHEEVLDMAVPRERPEVPQVGRVPSKAKITFDDVLSLRESGSMYDADPKVFSEQLWVFLNLQISRETANFGRNHFDNVVSLNGLEAWRRLVVPLESKSPAQRHSLQGLIQTPVRSKSLETVMDALEIWYKNLTKYIVAGGPGIG